MSVFGNGIIMWKPGLDFCQEHGHLLVHLGNVHIDSLSKNRHKSIAAWLMSAIMANTRSLLAARLFNHCLAHCTPDMAILLIAETSQWFGKWAKPVLCSADDSANWPITGSDCGCQPWPIGMRVVNFLLEDPAKHFPHFKIKRHFDRQSKTRFTFYHENNISF